MINPIISIIIPVYNVEKYIHRCMESILSQTFSDFECILVDDCSTDTSGQLCDDYIKKDNRIKVIHNSQNKGSSQTRKVGFEESKGEFILFLDSDDWIEPDMVSLLYQKAELDNCDITICNVYYEDKHKTVSLIKQDFSSYDKISIIKKLFCYNLRAYLVNKLIKRNLLLLTNFPELSRSEDYVISIQNIYNAQNIGYILKPLYHYCYNDLSLSQNKKNIIVGHIEMSENWHLLLDFLKDKYGKLNIFEPELSNRINEMKIQYTKDIKDKELKKQLFNLYPESKFTIWCLKYNIKKY